MSRQPGVGVRRRPRRMGTAVATTLTVVVLATGCASTAGGGTGTSSSPAAGSAHIVSAAKARVNALRKPSNTFVAPGAPLDAKNMRGKTIWYVSLSQSIPVLAAEQEGLRQAADALGATLRVCDGKFQPAVAAGCVNRAVASGAAGVIMDSITTDSVHTAVADATSHKVPVLALAAVGTDSRWVAYGTNGDEASQAAAADWIVNDSRGTARVLGTKVQDDSGAINDTKEGSQPIFDACHSCKFVKATYSSSTVRQIPSLVSATLLRNSDIDYGFPQFDFLVPQFKAGVRTANRTAKMKIVSTNGVLSSMKMVRDGGQDADIVSNRNYSGWLAMDAMLRMLKGMPVTPRQKWRIPIRIFDKTNIGSVQLTDQAAMSGQWLGPLDYRQDFRKLWGLGPGSAK